jgi:ATP-dependent Clp protease ATP-binding subunit ClpC
MFERFTDRARRVVVLAQEEARVLNHNYIGTEHLLLGLIHEGDGIAARALASFGVDLEKARAQVEQIIGRGQHATSGHIPFTPRAKKVLELSLREALQLGDNHIGTEHILLALLREGEGVAAQVLIRLGAELKRVRREVSDLRQREGPETGERLAAERESRALQVSARRSRPPSARDRPWDDILVLLTDISERLHVVERRLGISPAPVARAGGPADQPERGQAAATETSAGDAAADTPEPGDTGESPEAAG